MPTTTATAGIGGILPDGNGDLIIRPLQDESIAFNPRVATGVLTANHRISFPVITADPSSAWVAEGNEITPEDAAFAEVTVTPLKVAGLTVISNELANDSSPAAAGIVGQALARSLARTIDAALFANTTTNGPSGLGSVTGATALTSALTDLDVFAEAVSAAKTNGEQITSFLANPADALTLAQLKDETGSARPLLATDVTGALTVNGIPILTSAAAAQGTLWGVPARAVYTVIREDVTVESSAEAYFSSDRTGVRAIARIGFAFVNPAAIVKITVSED